MSEELQNNFINLSLNDTPAPCPPGIQVIFSKLNSTDPQSIFEGLVMILEASEGEPSQIDCLLTYKLHSKIMQFWGNPRWWYVIAWTLCNMSTIGTQACYDVIAVGGLGAFYDCLTISDSRMVEQGMWGLANIATNDKTCAKLVASHRNFRILFSVSEASIPLILETYVWLLSIIAQCLKVDSNISWSAGIFACQYALTQDSTPSRTIKKALNLLRLLTKKTETSREVFELCSGTLLRYLTYPSETCQYLAISALGEFMSDSDNTFTDNLLQADVLVRLSEFLGHTNPQFRNIAAYCVSNIAAGTVQQAYAVVNSGLLATLSELLYSSNDRECRKECAHVFLNFLAVRDCDLLARLLNDGLASHIVEAQTIIPIRTFHTVREVSRRLEDSPIHAQFVEALQQANYREEMSLQLTDEGIAEMMNSDSAN